MKEDFESDVDAGAPPSRREFLGKIGKSAIAATAASAIVPFIGKGSEVSAQKGANGNSFYHQRAQACYQFRSNCAKDNFQPIPPLFSRPTNGDENLYPNKIGNYSKGLPHQSNGEVLLSAYNALLSALNTGNPNAFEQLPL